MQSEKLQKLLAQAGYGSRREIERMIQAGRVTVNGKQATIGDRATGRDKIFINGKLANIATAHSADTKILLYHKPIGEICSNKDFSNRKTVFDNLPPLKTGKWIMIGRLDINTCGLLLFTNNGELANQMMHPKYGREREYMVRVLGELTLPMLAHLKQGVALDDGVAKFKQIHPINGVGANHWYRVVLTEGRHREVRRLFESQGLKVNRLIRTRFGDYVLPKDLQPGHYVFVKQV